MILHVQCVYETERERESECVFYTVEIRNRHNEE